VGGGGHQTYVAQGAKMAKAGPVSSVIKNV
jgi:hypothetical protein